MMNGAAVFAGMNARERFTCATVSDIACDMSVPGWNCSFMIEAPWIITIPGIALMITVMGLNLLGDVSERGIAQALGLMVNYRYDIGEIEQNHEAYAEHRTIVAAPAIRKIARNLELVPAK